MYNIALQWSNLYLIEQHLTSPLGFFKKIIFYSLSNDLCEGVILPRIWHFPKTFMFSSFWTPGDLRRNQDSHINCLANLNIFVHFAGRRCYSCVTMG